MITVGSFTNEAFDRIRECLAQLRNFTISAGPLNKIIGERSQLNSALDLVEDTAIAMASYLRVQFPHDEGEKYLLLCGLIQVLYLQQDGLRNILEALNMPWNCPPDMREIREIRNDAFGHPSKRRSKKGEPHTFHFLGPCNISNANFEIMSTKPDGPDREFRKYNAIDLVKRQAFDVVRILEGVIAEIKKQELKHRSKFRKMKLLDLFPQTMDYHFEKLHQGIDHEEQNYRELGKSNLDKIVETYSRFKSELEKRGEFPANTDFLEMIMYPLEKLVAYFDDPNASGLNKRDAMFLAMSAWDRHRQAIERAKTIDDDYEERPE